MKTILQIGEKMTTQHLQVASIHFNSSIFKTPWWGTCGECCRHYCLPRCLAYGFAAFHSRLENKASYSGDLSCDTIFLCILRISLDIRLTECGSYNMATAVTTDHCLVDASFWLFTFLITSPLIIGALVSLLVFTKLVRMIIKIVLIIILLSIHLLNI